MLFETEIKAALKKAGLAESLFDQIQVKTVDEIEGKVTALKADMDRVKNLTPDEFLEAVKKAGLEEPFRKMLNSEADRRAGEAIKTHDEKLRLAAEAEANKKKQADDQAGMTEAEKKIATLEEVIGKLNARLDDVSTKFTEKDLQSEIKKALIGEKLSEEFLPYIKVKEVSEIPDAVASLKGKLLAHEQEVIGEKIKNGEFAQVGRGQAGATVQENLIAEYAASKGANGMIKNADFPGKISSAVDARQSVTEGVKT